MEDDGLGLLALEHLDYNSKVFGSFLQSASPPADHTAADDVAEQLLHSTTYSFLKELKEQFGNTGHVATEENKGHMIYWAHTAQNPKGLA